MGVGSETVGVGTKTVEVGGEPTRRSGPREKRVTASSATNNTAATAPSALSWALRR
jgi:hypothetical protein